MFVVFRNYFNTMKIIDFEDVVAISYSDGYYNLTSLDGIVRRIDARQYFIIAVETED